MTAHWLIIRQCLHRGAPQATLNPRVLQLVVIPSFLLLRDLRYHHHLQSYLCSTVSGRIAIVSVFILLSFIGLRSIFIGVFEISFIVGDILNNYVFGSNLICNFSRMILLLLLRLGLDSLEQRLLLIRLSSLLLIYILRCGGKMDDVA